MKNFSVGKNVAFGGDVNVGIAPGKFDTKQLILSSIVVLSALAKGEIARFVRTVNLSELSRCKLFINDDFTTMFPVIPSCHDIKTTWEENSKDILRMFFVCDEEGIEKVTKSVEDKICNLEAIDFIMELYENRKNSGEDTFEEALNITLNLIEKYIRDSARERMYYLTIKNYVDLAEENYIAPPSYVHGWRNILKDLPNGEKIEYAIFPDTDNTYIIESKNKNISIKKYVKGANGITYSGRFFVRVNSKETAKELIKKLPTSKSVICEEQA